MHDPEVGAACEQAGHDPADGTGTADAEVAPHGGQDQGRNAAAAQFQDAADEGYAGNTHALQGVAVDENLAQEDIKRNGHLQIEEGLFHEDFVMVRREDADEFPAIAVHGNGCDQAERQGHEGALADALADAAVLAGAVVLGRIDGHGDAEGNHGLQGQLFDFRRRYEAGNGFGSKSIADRLEDQDAHGDDEELDGHGQTQAQVLPGKGPVEGPVGPGQAQHGKTAAHETQAEYGRNGLSDDQGDGRTGDAPAKDDDEQQGQGDVQEGRHDEEIEWSPAVAEGPADTGQEIITHHGHQAEYDDEHIMIGIVV